jgi:hypothetical protein
MITIFCDFRQFSAKKWRFSQKPITYDHILLQLSPSGEKTLFFDQILQKVATVGVSFTPVLIDFNFQNDNIGPYTDSLSFQRGVDVKNQPIECPGGVV